MAVSGGMHRQMTVQFTRGTPHSNDKRYAVEGTQCIGQSHQLVAVQRNNTQKNTQGDMVLRSAETEPHHSSALPFRGRVGGSAVDPRVCALLSWAHGSQA